MNALDSKLHVTRLVCATAGCMPLLIAAWRWRLLLLSVTAIAVSLGIFSASVGTVSQDGVSDRARLIGALNAAAAVIFTLGCCVAVGIHGTLVGTIRILWLVALVTSSSGYVYVQELFPEVSFIPNDLAIGATAVSVLLLLASIIGARISDRQHVSDKRAVFIELTLAAGAMTLRFDDELYKMLTIQLGWAAWHVSCWVSALVALYIVERPPRAHSEEESQVTIEFSDAEMPPGRQYRV